MKPLTFARKSWHARIVSHFFDLKDTNLCSYVYKFLFSIVITLMFGSLLLPAIMIVLAGLIYPIGLIFGHHWFVWHGNTPQHDSAFGEAGMYIDLVMGFMFVLLFVIPDAIDQHKKRRHDRIYNNRQRQVPRKEPDVLRLMWRGFREKTCSRIEFK